VLPRSGADPAQAALPVSIPGKAAGPPHSSRRFPPPWAVEEADAKLERQCFVVSDASGRERRSESLSPAIHL
jgi:hypothetical protein